jgi:hypothetical protein
MTVGTFVTGTTLTGSGLSIDRLYAAAGLTLSSTPGRVGVCLSGGGSHALAARMDQLPWGTPLFQLNPLEFQKRHQYATDAAIAMRA